MRSTSLERLAVLASAVFIADFATKQWALRALGEADAVGHGFGAGVHLAVVNNTRLAWGLETGGFELQLTALATILLAALVVRVCHQLADVDPAAPTMLGLLVGAGGANLADALIPPHGVVDFIGVTSAHGRTTSFNIADIAAAVGLVLCIRTAWRIGGSMRRSHVRHTVRVRTATHQAHGSRRDGLLLSAGHALLAMCASVWLYSMVVAWTPDAGASAPNSLLCGLGVFGVVFAASQARQLLSMRRNATVASVQASAHAGLERVVLDGSLAVSSALDDEVGTGDQPAERKDVEVPVAWRQTNVADGETRSD